MTPTPGTVGAGISCSYIKRWAIAGRFCTPGQTQPTWSSSLQFSTKDVHSNFCSIFEGSIPHKGSAVTGSDSVLVERRTFSASASSAFTTQMALTRFLTYLSSSFPFLSSFLPPFSSSPLSYPPSYPPSCLLSCLLSYLPSSLVS